jgi:murein DD-endopeptidase MepM/ murein hydrolase activator NlpD
VAAKLGMPAMCGGRYGNYVRIRHANGRETRYAHLRDIDPRLTIGSRVSQGQQIATQGNTGFSTGTHLHFELRINEVAVDPLPYLNLNRR